MLARHNVAQGCFAFKTETNGFVLPPAALLLQPKRCQFKLLDMCVTRRHLLMAHSMVGKKLHTVCMRPTHTKLTRSLSRTDDCILHCGAHSNVSKMSHIVQTYPRHGGLDLCRCISCCNRSSSSTGARNGFLDHTLRTVGKSNAQHGLWYKLERLVLTKQSQEREAMRIIIDALLMPLPARRLLSHTLTPAYKLMSVSVNQTLVQA